MQHDGPYIETRHGNHLKLQRKALYSGRVSRHIKSLWHSVDPRHALQDGKTWDHWPNIRLDEEIPDRPDNESENRQQAVHRKDSREHSTTGSGIENLQYSTSWCRIFQPTGIKQKKCYSRTTSWYSRKLKDPAKRKQYYSQPWTMPTVGEGNRNSNSLQQIRNDHFHKILKNQGKSHYCSWMTTKRMTTKSS